MLNSGCEELTHLKRPWCWERLKAGGEGDERGWDGGIASPTRWTWIWVNSRNWWWTGWPGVQQSMGLQRVEHNWATELNRNSGEVLMIENTCSPSPKLRLVVQTKQGTLQSEKRSTDVAENRGGGGVFPLVTGSVSHSASWPSPALLGCTPWSRSDRARVKGQSRWLNSYSHWGIVSRKNMGNPCKLTVTQESRFA